MNKLPISAMVVGFNEASLLKKCLSSINFCDGIIYTGLGSSGNSVEIARKFASTILHRQKVPSCEMIQTEVVHYLKHDWVIFIDPDEAADETLQAQIVENFIDFQNNAQLGAVLVPWQFYFKKKKLHGTVWGGINQKYFLVHRKKFAFSPIVHYGRKLLEGYISHSIHYTGKNVLHHYWMNSYTVFIRKHRRYLLNEAKDQYDLGVRISWKEAISKPFKAFKESFVDKKGYNDGLTGFALSVFWSYYKTVIALGLLRIQWNSKNVANV